MEIKTDNYFKKKIVNLLFSEGAYHRIKLYKIIYDFMIGKSYENIEEILPNLIDSSAVVIDIEANMGQYACRLNKYLKNGFVYSIEPFIANYNALVEMKRILKLDNVMTYHLAISDKNSFLNLKIPITKNKLVIGTQAVLESYEKATFDDVTYRIEKITSTTLDKFIFNEKLKKVDLIKIDTEGAEIAVLKGGLECLKMDMPILIVEIDPGNNQLSFLYELGYEAYSFTDTTLRRFDKNSNKHYGNSIFIHKEKSRLVKDGGIK